MGRKKSGKATGQSAYQKKPVYEERCPPCLAIKEIHNRDGSVTSQCSDCGTIQGEERK